jgi:uncharacterized membrane protein
MSGLDWLTSKTFWAGVGLVGFGVYQITQGSIETGVQSILAGLAALGLRHAVAKSNGN